MEATILLVLWEIIILGLLLPPQKIDIFQFTKRIIISTKPQWWSTLYTNKIILNRIDLEKINTYASDKLNIYYGFCKLDQIFSDPKSQLLKNWPPSAFKNIFTIVSSQSISHEDSNELYPELTSNKMAQIWNNLQLNNAKSIADVRASALEWYRKNLQNWHVIFKFYSISSTLMLLPTGL